MTILRVQHVTSFDYASEVRFCDHRLMVRPRDGHDQRLLSVDLQVSPVPREIRWVQDVFGNVIAVTSFAEPADQLRFEASILLENTPLMVPRCEVERRAQVWPFEYAPEQLPDLRSWMTPEYPAVEVTAFAQKFTRAGLETETGHVLMTMARGIRESFKLVPPAGLVTQRPEQTLALKQGTSRDFALLMIEACRALGFAARFVSGYAHSSALGELAGGTGATHAWVQVFLPEAGWVEFDPTLGAVGGVDLVRVAIGRDAWQAQPISGNYVGDRATFLGMQERVDIVTDVGFQKVRSRASEAGRRLSLARGGLTVRRRPADWHAGEHP